MKIKLYEVDVSEAIDYQLHHTSLRDILVDRAWKEAIDLLHAEEEVEKILNGGGRFEVENTGWQFVCYLVIPESGNDNQ